MLVDLRVLAFVLSLLVASCQHNSLTLNLKTITADNNIEFVGEWGEMVLPENPDDQDSPIIQLPFFRLKTKAQNKLPPIFVLAGGPGDSPSILEQLPTLLPMISELNEKSDLIILEQRGNGFSKPNLACPGFIELDLNESLTPSRFEQAYRKYINECYGNFPKDRLLQSYNVTTMVSDIESIRKGLGYDKIILFGGSFGSFHALNYIGAHPENVDRALLDSPEGLSHTVKLPSTADRSLEGLSQMVDENEVLHKRIPSFMDLVEQILSELEQNPVTVNLSNNDLQEKSIVIGKYDLQLITALELGRMGYREIPFRYLEMQSGNFNWLGEYAYQIRRFENRNLMAVATDCSSGASKERWEQVHKETSNAILGDALNNINFTACEDLGINPVIETNLKSKKSEVPLLLICGTQDARTPLSNAHEIARQHRHSKILEVKYGSHDLFREVFDELFPIMKEYLSIDNPMNYQIPIELIANNKLRTSS